ncbi:down syndrome cell adhesion molecule homolog [Clonorchis sinensis]|uniref:Down syndrome cell adhesion molecule homolog n=1 Tax=Clonorchis sinensis TaxID=79923 RepID=G7YE40_CLOSI|nr:down syndrome cell adhesion molecule homolog [Clonorchis sinensis]
MLSVSTGYYARILLVYPRISLCFIGLLLVQYTCSALGIADGSLDSKIPSLWYDVRADSAYSSLPSTTTWPLHSANLARYFHRRTRRGSSNAVPSPPRIVPDLPTSVRFFDRTGYQIRCRATGYPPPTIRWFWLPTTNGGQMLPASPDHLIMLSAIEVPIGDGSNLSEVASLSRSANHLETSSSLAGHPAPSGLESSYYSSFERDQVNELLDQVVSTKSIVVGDGWLNFTAAGVAAMRWVLFCQAENYLGRARSRKMVAHQVPLPDENLRIIYNTFHIDPGQKAVISCHPEQSIFNRFLKVHYWEIYMNGTLIHTVDHSFDRFSMINVTKHPELHIRSVTEAELEGLEVRCVLQSIVDESVKVERPERGRLRRLRMGLFYTEQRSVSSDVDVLRGSTVELPWAVEGKAPVGANWFYVNTLTGVRYLLSSDTPLPLPDGSGKGISPANSSQHSYGGRKVPRFLPGGTEYELVNGAYGNLRLINLSVADSGQFMVEVPYSARPQVKYTVQVRAPLGVKITPSQRTVDWGSHVELDCIVTGNPRHLVYWLHNGRPAPRRHHVRTVSGPAAATSSTEYVGTSKSLDSLSQRLIIEAFTLEDVGVYQCVVENGQTVGSLASNVLPTLTGSFHSDTTAAGSSESPDRDLTHPPVSLPTAGEVLRDLTDNAQATALLLMGKMRPSLKWQNPAVEPTSIKAQVLLSIHSVATTNVTLECRFAANPTPKIDWFRDDLPIPLEQAGVIAPELAEDTSTPYTLITRLRIDIRKAPNLEELWVFGGEYRAVATNPHGEADCRTYVLLETPLRLRPMDALKVAIAGRAHTLKCYFIGSGIPALQWHRIKNGREIQRIPVDHRHHLLEDGRVLRITEISQEEDEAEYRCTAILGDHSANSTVKLKVSHAPRLFELPQTRQVKYTHDTLSYSCTLQNRADKPWYAWWEFQHEGTNALIPLPASKQERYNEFVVSYMDDLVSRSEGPPWRLPDSLRDKVPLFAQSEPNAGVHVSVNKLQKEKHHGNLTCVVVNEVGEDRQSIRITFIPELEFAIRPPNNQDVTLGQTMTIDCAAKPSDLKPVVEWKYLQKTTGNYVGVSELSEATNGRIRQYSNGTLLLSNVDESDPREFLCFLKPGRLSTAAQRSSAVNLEVHVPARIDPIDHVERVRGSRFNLTCSVHGDPDDLQAAWYYRPSGRTKWQLIDKPCVVPWSILDKEHLPDGMTSAPTHSDQSSDSSLTPDSSDEHSSSVDCQSFANEGLESGILFRQVAFFKPNKRGLDKQLQFISVKEAHMGEYLCRASNRFNRDAQGARTEVEVFVRLTVISVPGPVNIVYNSSRTTATTVFFEWHAPTHDGNKPIRKYRIRYAPSEPSKLSLSRGPQPNVTEIEVDESTRQILLEGLRPYTMYRITLVAINDVGPSEENVLPLTTQEAKPDGPVRRLVANGTASDTIVVSWDNPAPEHLNGNVDRYWVCRQRVNATFSTSELARLTWPADSPDHMSGQPVRGRFGHVHCAKILRQKDYEVTGLPKFTAYAFRVIALNSKGSSPPAFTQARTLEDLPQAPPTDVTCTSQQHSITVSWNPPHPDTINGILTEYHVRYFAANVFGDETTSVNQAVQGQTTVTLAGLLAFTNYSIQVAVSNRKGRGPSSTRIICRTKEAPPTAPDRVKATPLNASCLVVSWSHPRKPQGLTKQYCIEAIPLVKAPQDGLIGLSGSPSPERAKALCVRPDFSMSYNQYTYCGLMEQRPYNISVRATNHFEGHKAWTGPVYPVANPPPGIISIGGKLQVQNKMPVSMDCLVTTNYPVRWSYPLDDLDGISLLDNGTLSIKSTETAHSGTYQCTVLSDTISYDLVVQGKLQVLTQSNLRFFQSLMCVHCAKSVLLTTVYSME